MVQGRETDVDVNLRNMSVNLLTNIQWKNLIVHCILILTVTGDMKTCLV